MKHTLLFIADFIMVLIALMLGALVQDISRQKDFKDTFPCKNILTWHQQMPLIIILLVMVFVCKLIQLTIIKHITNEQSILSTPSTDGENLQY